MYTVFLPMLFQAGLTLAILIVMTTRRVSAVQKDPALMNRAALDISQYPEDIVKLSNNFANQSQTPPIFYVACLLALITGTTGIAVGVCAWGFIATRIVHTIIHTTHNNVRMRAAAFGMGVLFLTALWVIIAMNVAEKGLFPTL